MPQKLITHNKQCDNTEGGMQLVRLSSIVIFKLDINIVDDINLLQTPNSSRFNKQNVLDNLYHHQQYYHLTQVGMRNSI